MFNKPFTTWPLFEEEEINAVRDVLLSNKVNYWTGEECQKFEKEFANWSNSKYAVTLANGTVALDIALKAIRVGTGDEIIVTSRTFIASVSSIVEAGATPVFVDVDRNSQNITSATILPAITNKTRAIICVHLAGYPCEMDEIMGLAKLNNLYVIEDCAQAHGASYNGRPVGSIGHIGAWSFCQDKIMTTGGEGGMVTTSNSDLLSRMWSYKDHGKSYESLYNNENSNGFRWLHDSFGTNWRMTEMQAAIGRIQLKKMADWHNSRENNAKKIISICQKFPLLYRVPCISEDIEHAWYKCYVFVRNNGLKNDWSRDRVISEIFSRGVPCYNGSCSEVYLEKAFEDTDFRPGKRLEVAKELGETALMFLVHPTLTIDEIELTCSVIEEVSLLAQG